MAITDRRPGAGPTARRRGTRSPWSVTALAVLAVALAGSLAGCGGSGSTPKTTSDVAGTYGSLPSFLPTAPAGPADSTLTATVAHPALTVEGDDVEVQLGGRKVLATVTGPQVPGEGLPYQTGATTCTWTVTLSGASGDVPISVADFTSLDHLGAVYHPTLVAGRPAPPKVLRPGAKVSFDLRAVMTVGEGLMRWAPGGRQVLASWDFEVEND